MHHRHHQRADATPGIERLEADRRGSGWIEAGHLVVAFPNSARRDDIAPRGPAGQRKGHAAGASAASAARGFQIIDDQ